MGDYIPFLHPPPHPVTAQCVRRASCVMRVVVGRGRMSSGMLCLPVPVCSK